MMNHEGDRYGGMLLRESTVKLRKITTHDSVQTQHSAFPFEPEPRRAIVGSDFLTLFTGHMVRTGRVFVGRNP